MKLSEITHAWKNKQVTPRREQFLWTQAMTDRIEPDHIDPNRTGMTPRYKVHRLTQAETPITTRQNKDVLQFVVLDRNDECVRYNPSICIKDSPKHKDVVKGAMHVHEVKG